MYNDKTIICVDCGNKFIFSSGEQEFYNQKGFKTEPTRCKTCRIALRDRLKPQRAMYEVVCSKCQKIAKVPFEPRHDKPILCEECYKMSKKSSL